MIWDTLTNFPLEQFLAFMAGAVVLHLAPGQDVLFATACGVGDGPRAGALAGLGVGLGSLIHVVLATAGLGALISAHPGALMAVKYAGAAYLLILAYKSWNAGKVAAHARAPHSVWHIFRRGMLSNLLNPKIILFLLAFLPQFTRPEYGPIWHQILGLGIVFTISGTFITGTYGVIAGFAGQAMGNRLGVMNRIAAVMFAGLAVRLVWK